MAKNDGLFNDTTMPNCSALSECKQETENADKPLSPADKPSSPADTSLKLDATTIDSQASDEERSQAEQSNRIEKLMLQDTNLETAPLHLYQLLEHFDDKKLTQAELLLLLIYTVALESGYVTEKERENSDIVEISAVSSYHSKNVLHLSSIFPTYTCDEEKLFFSIRLHSIIDIPVESPNVLSSLLTAAVTGDYMIVTLTPHQSTKALGASICLSIGRYVLNNKGKGQPLSRRFRMLNELATELRENLYVPIRNQQLELLNVQLYPSLLGLPAELYDEIFQYLNHNQLKILANVDKHLNSFVKYSKYYEKKT